MGTQAKLSSTDSTPEQSNFSSKSVAYCTDLLRAALKEKCAFDGTAAVPRPPGQCWAGCECWLGAAGEWQFERSEGNNGVGLQIGAT
jgi:hypothetical protein